MEAIGLIKIDESKSQYGSQYGTTTYVIDVRGADEYSAPIALTTFTIHQTGENLARIDLKVFSHEGCPAHIQLESDQMDQLCRLWQGDKESRSLSELRGLYDELQANATQLVSENEVLVQNQIDATEDIERITEIKNDLDDECVRLQIVLQKLEEAVYHANTKCGKAVNHAEILERRAKELLEAINAQIARWELDDASIPDDIRHAVIRLEKYLDDCAAHKQLEALTPGGDSPEEVTAIRQENDALKRRIEQLQYAVIQGYMNIESGHASYSHDVLVAMHPYEDDPYGLQHLPKADPQPTQDPILQDLPF